MKVLVSVIVPTCHRPQLLDRCLKALLAQTLEPSRYEILVVDDGKTGIDTRSVVEKWQSYLATRDPVIPVTGNYHPPKKNGHAQVVQFQGSAGLDEPIAIKVAPPARTPQLRYLRSDQTQGPAAARNLGWRACAGDIVAFTDDDCIPDPNWLRLGLAAFIGDVAGVSGRVIVPLPPKPTDHELNTRGLETSLFVTANCFYRKDALQAVGGFDERFRAAWREDSDLFFTLQEQGYLLVSTPESVVIHPPRPAPWGSSIPAQRKSFYNALLFKKHPRLYRKYLQPQPPWNYYMMALALLVALFGLLGPWSIWSAAGAGLWSGLVLNLAIRRLEKTVHTPSHVLEMVLTSMVIPVLSIYWRLRGAIRFQVLFF